jgi:hypothetical protein
MFDKITAKNYHTKYIILKDLGAMIRKLIVLTLAVIGLAAILYFGIGWIETGLDNLKQKAEQGYNQIKDVREKIDEITDFVKPSGT